jgi:hypothetical protein
MTNKRSKTCFFRFCIYYNHADGIISLDLYCKKKKINYYIYFVRRGRMQGFLYSSVILYNPYYSCYYKKHLYFPDSPPNLQSKFFLLPKSLTLCK